MRSFYTALAITAVALSLGRNAHAQDGTDISTAIPIYFNQIVTDTIDNKTRPAQVYSVTLAKGQQITITYAGNGGSYLILLSPASRSVGTGTRLGQDYGNNGLINYQVSTGGTYFVWVSANASGITYKLQVTAQGTPINVPNPATAGCVTGQIDSITYSLQLIAAGLPDEVSIAGTKLCASCTVKPPAYMQIVDKMESAMGMNVGVSACYDTSGNIFQLKLLHP